MVGSLVSKMWDKELRDVDLRNEGTGALVISFSFGVSYSKIANAVRRSFIGSRSCSGPSPSIFELRTVYKGHHQLLNCGPSEE
jgi:hypothetical protein